MSLQASLCTALTLSLSACATKPWPGYLCTIRDSYDGAVLLKATVEAGSLNDATDVTVEAQIRLKRANRIPAGSFVECWWPIPRPFLSVMKNRN